MSGWTQRNSREQQWLDRVYHEIDKQLAYQQDKVEVLQKCWISGAL